ncbi:hypothetical protein, partial [Blastococcus sp. CT_GayMR20]|uniref:hypothetical protein n=1 Tax=Blastococcus sp. CT_GayMR20 TaxID=2559609 RepID=UPI001FD78045
MDAEPAQLQPHADLDVGDPVRPDDAGRQVGAVGGRDLHRPGAPVGQPLHRLAGGGQRGEVGGGRRPVAGGDRQA